MFMSQMSHLIVLLLAETIGAAHFLPTEPANESRKLQSTIRCGCGRRYNSCSECPRWFCRGNTDCHLLEGQCVLKDVTCSEKAVNEAIVGADPISTVPGEQCISAIGLKNGQSCPLNCKIGQPSIKTGKVSCDQGKVNVEPPTCTVTFQERQKLKEGVTCMGAEFKSCAECDIQWCATSFPDEDCKVDVSGGPPKCILK